MKKHNKKYISAPVETEIRLKNEHKVFRKIYLKYMILRVRAKISLIAFEKRMTILELFVSTIQSCYIHLMISRVIPRNSAEENERHRWMYDCLTKRGN